MKLSIFDTTNECQAYQSDDVDDSIANLVTTTLLSMLKDNMRDSNAHDNYQSLGNQVRDYLVNAKGIVAPILTCLIEFKQRDLDSYCRHYKIDAVPNLDQEWPFIRGLDHTNVTTGRVEYDRNDDGEWQKTTCFFLRLSYHGDFVGNPDVVVEDLPTVGHDFVHVVEDYLEYPWQTGRESDFQVPLVYLEQYTQYLERALKDRNKRRHYSNKHRLSMDLIEKDDCNEFVNILITT